LRSQPLSFTAAKRRAIALFEKDYLTRLMLAQGGNVSQAARVAGKDRSDLGKLLKKHRLGANGLRFPVDGLPRGPVRTTLADCTLAELLLHDFFHALFVIFRMSSFSAWAQ
jgi:hypothetical protein